MAAIAASNVTYTFPSTAKHGMMDNNANRVEDITIAFGNGTLTYPSGGVSLANLSANGFPNKIQSLVIVDAANANGFVYKYDKTNNKLRIYQQDGTTGGLTELAGAATPAAASLVIRVTGY